MPIIAKSENINILWANLIIEEFVRHGIDYFCISPGSRSTPLAVAAARHSITKTKIIFDERGAAFHALGFARATGKPVVLICTSGTAAANYFPAVIEASQENLPLIILSADRPIELRNSGANQTTNQVELYGKYSRLFIDVPCPTENIKPSWILSQVDKAVAIAGKKTAAGPVQINCMFKEPLAPEVLPFSKEYLKDIDGWLEAAKPLSTRGETEQIPDDISAILNVIDAADGGIILAGRNENPNDPMAILSVAEKIKWPVFADITSGIRTQNNRYVLHYFDQLLVSPLFIKNITGKPILHFGGQFVSKRLLQFLEKQSGPHIHIFESNKRIDPAFSVTHRIHASISGISQRLLTQVRQNPETDFFKTVFAQNKQVAELVIKYDSQVNELSEIAAARIISREINKNSALFIASSMPIRDMDMYASPGNKNIQIGANRGASGIDGTIASALGFATGHQKNITIFMGDLAFIHDLNSLSQLAEMQESVTIVLLNNQGGGIFSFLPIAGYSDVFEKYFSTPHTFTFDKAAAMFGLNYYKPENMQKFKENYLHCQKEGGFNLIEVCTKRDDNFSQHKVLQESIRSILS